MRRESSTSQGRGSGCAETRKPAQPEEVRQLTAIFSPLRFGGAIKVALRELFFQSCVALTARLRRQLCWRSGVSPS